MRPGQVGPVMRALATIPTRIWLALAVLLVGAALSYLVVVVNRRLLERAGVPESIEGTAFERTARSVGTSTVSIVARLSGYFIFILTVLVALTVADVRYISVFWNSVAIFLPRLFVAVLVLVVGIVLGDKVELVVSERLSDVKIPQTSLLPLVAKYSVFYIAVLVALSQIDIATAALLILLAAYAFGLVVFGAIAFRDLLASAAVGTYLLLNQPYGIGDRIRVGDTAGIVQEIDMFVTVIETDDEELVVPNRQAFTEGIVLVRD